MNVGWVLAGLGVVAGLGLLASPVQARPSMSGSADPSKVDAVRALSAQADLPTEWGDFFALVAWRESKGNPAAINDDPSEAEAAQQAYDRNRDRFANCGHPASAYTFGSGGWFGMLPANALSQLQGADRCLPPTAVLDPEAALAMAVGFARGLMQWHRYQRTPTWLNLRAMWGWPARGGEPVYLAQVRPKLEADAVVVGLPRSWLDRRPPPLPLTGSEVLARLRATRSNA